MKILITGHHLSIGDALHTHIEESVAKHVKKYFENPIQANVTLTKEKSHIIRTDILINEGTGTGIIIKSNGEDQDAYRSFDQAIMKAEKQLRKHKSRIKDHQKRKEDRILEAKKYVFSPFGEDADFKGDAPAIIAEKVATIKKLSVSDAVMQMDLQDLPAYIFINSGNDRVNVVYYRKDGNIAWVDVPAANK